MIGGLKQYFKRTGCLQRQNNTKHTPAKIYRVITLPHLQKTFKTATFYARQYRVSFN